MRVIEPCQPRVQMEEPLQSRQISPCYVTNALRAARGHSMPAPSLLTTSNGLSRSFSN